MSENAGSKASIPNPVAVHFAPRNATEEQLGDIWREVLTTESIGIHDDFFDLGGTSLLAMQILAKTNSAFGTQVELSFFFESATIANLAEEIAQALDHGSDKTSQGRGDGGGGSKSGPSSLVELQPAGAKLPLFLIPPAASTSIWFGPLSRYLGDDQPVYSFDMLGIDAGEKFLDRVEDIAAHFMTELLNLRPQGPYLLGGMCFGAHVAYELAQQLNEKGQQSTLLLLDANAPLNGPSWQYRQKRFHMLRNALSNLIHSNLFRWSIHKMRSRMNADEQTRRAKERQRKARREYCARPFPGNVAIFQSDQFNTSENSRRWASLIHGECTTYLMKGKSHSSLLANDSGIRQLAGQISSYLDDLQK